MKKLFACALLFLAVFALSACQQRRSPQRQQQMQAQPQPQPRARRAAEPEMQKKPVILCRSAGCTRAQSDMSKEFIQETISNMFYINDKTQVLLCEADPITRDCRLGAIRYGASVGGTGAVMDLSSFIITDAVYSADMTRVIFSMNFDVYANGVRNPCYAGRTSVEVNDAFQAMLRDDGFMCENTSGEADRMRFNFNIDIVDLDYGLIGGYYITGTASEEQSSSARGYALMKFQRKPSQGRRVNPHQDEIDCDDEGSIPDGQYKIMPVKREPHAGNDNFRD